MFLSETLCLGTGGIRVAKEAVGIVLCNSGQGIDSSSSALLSSGDRVFLGDFFVTSFAEFARFGVLIAWRRADRRVCDNISGLGEREIAKFRGSDLARFGADSRFPPGVAGEGPRY